MGFHQRIDTPKQELKESYFSDEAIASFSNEQTIPDFLQESKYRVVDTL